MSETAHHHPLCGDCAHWVHAEAKSGLCRLHAPSPGDEPNAPAHWPRTRREDFCSSWLAKGAEAPRMICCVGCRYWEHVAGGITPIDLADQLMSWWAKAGHCKQAAPSPSTLPGHRAFWRATHEKDGCFAGKPR